MDKLTKNIMVDMSATLIHHGHIRLLEKASRLGKVIVGLTSDEQIILHKGYTPELRFNQRKEILESIEYVQKVVKTNWHINDATLKKYKIDLLVHGNDNNNNIDLEKLQIFPRTKEISSTLLRNNASKSIINIKNNKLMLTPGPAQLLYENISNLRPLFGRGDKDYDSMYNEVINWVKKMCGQDKVVALQGSSTLAIEIASKNFLKGTALLVDTGFYSNRIKDLIHKDLALDSCKYEELKLVTKEYDWIIVAYTETSEAFKVDIDLIQQTAKKIKAKIFLDATGSIGLEPKHHIADLVAFSSCKGLFGLAGACFIGYKQNLIKNNFVGSFYLDINTHINKLVTGPYHALASLSGIIHNHSLFLERVKKSKELIINHFPDTSNTQNQPLLCTYIKGEVLANDSDVVLYSPRSKKKGSIVCHLGEIHKDEPSLLKRITIKPFI